MLLPAVTPVLCTSPAVMAISWTVVLVLGMDSRPPWQFSFRGEISSHPGQSGRWSSHVRRASRGAVRLHFAVGAAITALVSMHDHRSSSSGDGHVVNIELGELVGPQARIQQHQCARAVSR